MPNDAAAVSEFVSKNGVQETSVPLLNSFVDFLKERGLFLNNGDLKTQFIEKAVVQDKNKVPIAVETCMICGNQQFEVKTDKP